VREEVVSTNLPLQLAQQSPLLSNMLDDSLEQFVLLHTLLEWTYMPIPEQLLH
jgi:hypothetical protein